MQCFQNALAYFYTVVSYTRKMFTKSTPGLGSVVGLVSVRGSGVGIDGVLEGDVGRVGHPDLLLSMV
jgi:hypothetical protein